MFVMFVRIIDIIYRFLRKKILIKDINVILSIFLVYKVLNMIIKFFVK